MEPYAHGHLHLSIIHPPNPSPYQTTFSSSSTPAPAQRSNIYPWFQFRKWVLPTQTAQASTSTPCIAAATAAASLFSSPSSSTPSRYENQLCRSPVTAAAFFGCCRIATTAPVSTVSMRG
ncbi:unnamed protein product, partial [Vitis vinifera]